MTHDETTIIAGALELTEKTAKDAMTPISKAFSLDLDGTLNLWVNKLLFNLISSFHKLLMFYNTSISLSLSCRETLNAIMTMGHSRVPVYYRKSTNIIGLILVINVSSMLNSIFTLLWIHLLC